MSITSIKLINFDKNMKTIINTLNDNVIRDFEQNVQYKYTSDNIKLSDYVIHDIDYKNKLCLMSPNIKTTEQPIFLICTVTNNTIVKPRLKIAVGSLYNNNNQIKNGYIVNINDLNKYIIVLGYDMLLYDEKGMIIASKKTTYNDLGLCSYGINNNNIIIATLGSKDGEIIIWHPEQDNHITIQAHANKISCLYMTYDGKQIATCSTSATNIHIFDCVNGTLLYKFRRNTALLGNNSDLTSSLGFKCSSIWSVCINNDKRYVACCSSNGTIHIYDTNTENESNNKKLFTSYLSNFVQKYTNIDYLKSSWGFSNINTSCGSKMICAFDNDDNLYVVSCDNKYYKISNNNFNTYDEHILIDN